MTEPLSIDQIIERLLAISEELQDVSHMKEASSTLKQLHSRLSGGELHIAIIGQFNRGKSTFINRLIGIELLPVSVLPLTAIPTEIKFGNENRLTITFPTTEINFTDPAAIYKALNEYVTEGENPENVKEVTGVMLTAPSPILSHGTTIIDTPGFGSTHIHNTKATLDRLRECDAALFLLSADLPITQMELNFIKQIAPQVTRLFFIYNKTDLLNSEELETTINFIKKTIEQQLRLSTSDRFFPVSAKMAEEDRDKSGLVTIETEVLSFLEREKYFSLAEAIRAKLELVRIDMITVLKEALEDNREEIVALEEAILGIEAEEAVLGEELAELNEYADSPIPFEKPMTEIETVVSERIAQMVHAMEKYDRSGLEQLNRAIEREYMGEITPRFQEAQQREHTRIFHKHNNDIPRFPLTEIASVFELLKPLTLSERIRPKRELTVRMLDRVSENIARNRKLFDDVIHLLLMDFRRKEIVRISENISEQLKELKAQKESLRSECNAIEDDKKERNDLLRSFRDEISTIAL